MKFVLLGFILFIVVTFSMRKRRGAASAQSKRHRARGASMYDSDEDAMNVRSADNIRLISDDQLSSVDGKRDKPVE